MTLHPIPLNFPMYEENFIFFFSHFIRDRQIAAYSWANSAIANPQISWKCQSANRNSASFHD
jgi:hypothetical protein